MNRLPKLLDQVRAKIRYKHYSIRTKETYYSWIKRFIVFHGKRHPRHRRVCRLPVAKSPG